MAFEIAMIYVLFTAQFQKINLVMQEPAKVKY